MRGVEKIIRLDRRLSHRTLDTAVRASSLYLEAGWASPCKVIFSMEAIEYADFGAAGRLVVFAEGLVRRGFGISLNQKTLPLHIPQATEFVEQL
jgi:hypothetical protein